MNLPAEVAKARVYEGLEGVVVAETRLSLVDGERGRLVVAGHDLEDLVELGFEQASALLFDAGGGATSKEQVDERFARGRALAHERLGALGDALDRRDAMDALRASVAHLPEHSTREEIVGALSVFTAAHRRRSEGLAAIAPPPNVGHAAALLTMLGAPADPARTRALDAYLITVMEHGFNASAFAARVVASTQSDLVSAIVAGIGALKGPLHGGAPGPVLEMLAAIGESDRAESYLQSELAAGRRIMGMGHRIYRQRDPRAYVLERALERLSASLGSARQVDGPIECRLALARAVEKSAERLLEQRYPGRNLRANVEFYTAVLLSSLDIPSAWFSAVFACARSVGWAAHYAEQRARGRLIRPQASYVGVLPVRANSA
jgi:citrate synthase